MTSRSEMLLGMDRAECSSLIEEVGEPSYRVQQIMEAVYRQRAGTIEEISTLALPLRRKLSEQGLSVGWPVVEKKFVSQDGTVRYLIGFADGQSVETVWMPLGDGGEAGDGTEAGDSEERFVGDCVLSPSAAKAATNPAALTARLKAAPFQSNIEDPGEVDDRISPQPAQALAAKRSATQYQRATICVSSQVGCAVDCQFCLTALLGVKRNLSAGEIVGQVCAVLKDQKVALPEDRINLVFMGMGEPFLNYDNFMKAIRLLVEEVGIAESRMTVSTAGIVPRIHDFGLEAIRPKLAISLNASNDKLRERVMPLNRKWNLEKLLAAARDFPLRNRERITFEYVLLREVNDSPQNAEEVVELLQGLRAKVNLIALNPGPGIDFQTPAEDRVATFQRILVTAGIPTFVRRPRGRDIYAACGQLKRTVEISPAEAPATT